MEHSPTSATGTVGAHAVAGDAAGGVGSDEEGRRRSATASSSDQIAVPRSGRARTPTPPSIGGGGGTCLWAESGSCGAHERIGSRTRIDLCQWARRTECTPHRHRGRSTCGRAVAMAAFGAGSLHGPSLGESAHQAWMLRGSAWIKLTILCGLMIVQRRRACFGPPDFAALGRWRMFVKFEG